MKQNRRFWLVQCLTASRALLLLVAVVLVACAPRAMSAGTFAAALAALALSAATDLIDGPLARAWKVASALGAHADPLLDKVFYLTALPMLVMLAALDASLHMALWLFATAVLMLLRDQWVTFLRSLGAARGMGAKANWSGKLRTLLGFPAICVAFYHLRAPADWPSVPPWAIYATLAALLAVNLVSMWVYTARYWPAIKAEMTRDQR